MSFLNKYKQDASSAATATRRDTSRNSLDVANATFDEDEMDMLFSSDSDAAGRHPRRKATSRLKASPDARSLEPSAGTVTAATTDGEFAAQSLTLSGMRSSGRFGTAKELGISESGRLDGPKAAVSPVGIQHNRSMNSSGGGTRHQADAGSPSEHQSSGLRLVVKIPGESSTYGSPVNHGSESDIDSVGSAMPEELEEQSLAGKEVLEAEPWLGSLNSELVVSIEGDGEGSSGLVSPTFEQQSRSATDLNQDDTVGGVDGFARSSPDRSAFGKVMSVDDLATVSRPQPSPQRLDRGTNAKDGIGSESSERNRSSSGVEGAETREDDDEDDYGDDDFEDQDVLMESIGETAPMAAGREINSASTAEATSRVSHVGQSKLHAGGAIDNPDREGLPRPLEAWSMPPAGKEEARSSPGTPDSGTSPRSCANDLKQERAPSGPTTAGGVTRPPFPDTDHCQQQSVNSAHGSEKEETTVSSLSKRGVLIDRSSEASNPVRPPDTKVKVITRAEAVASVEYAHNPESGLNLRSCGTQVWERPGLPFQSKTTRCGMHVALCTSENTIERRCCNFYFSHRFAPCGKAIYSVPVLMKQHGGVFGRVLQTPWSSLHSPAPFFSCQALPTSDSLWKLLFGSLT